MPPSKMIDRIQVSRSVEESSIRGKRIFVFEDDATAFIAWSKIRKSFDRSPVLISLDTHLDTRPAFNKLIKADTIDFKFSF
jgi:hypothetical protein